MDSLIYFRYFDSDTLVGLIKFGIYFSEYFVPARFSYTLFLVKLSRVLG